MKVSTTLTIVALAVQALGFPNAHPVRSWNQTRPLENLDAANSTRIIGRSANTTYAAGLLTGRNLTERLR